jgi:membrane fusion protein (multidrug efflux system)
VKFVTAVFRGLARGLGWPFRALYRLYASLFKRGGAPAWAASVVTVACVFLLLWNFAIAPGLMILNYIKMGKPQVAVDAVKVQAVSWAPGIEAVGSAKAIRGADLALQADGVVTAVLFTPQAHVEAGQALIQLDDAVEQADLIAASANVKLAESALSRTSELRRKGVNAQSTLDDSRNQLDVARSSQARIAALIDQKLLKAPFAGTVGIPKVDVGQYVTKGTTVVTLQDTDRLYVDFTLPEDQRGQLGPGQAVHFGLTESELPYSGTITAIEPHVDPQTRLINLRATIDDAQGRVMPGQFVRIRIDLPRESNIVALPATAVVPSLYGDYVYLIESGEKTKSDAMPHSGTAKQVMVEVGRRTKDLVEIKSGVSTGQYVVKGGQNKLHSGADIVVSDVPSGASLANNGAHP